MFDGERVMIRTQDQGLLKNGFKKMTGIPQNEKCRFCHTAVESINHLLSGCEILQADSITLHDIIRSVNTYIGKYAKKLKLK